MFVLKVKINLIIALGNLLLNMRQNRESIANVDFMRQSTRGGTIYSVGSFRTEKGPDLVTYDTAVAFCKVKRMDLYFVEANHDIMKLMADLDMDSLWTGIFRSKSTGTLSDAAGFAPQTVTDYDQVIKLTETDTNAIDAKHHVSLVKNNNVFSYEMAGNEERRSVICVTELSFPGKQQDITRMEIIKNSFIERIKTSEKRVKAIWNQVSSAMATLPDLSIEESSIYDQMLDLQNVSEKLDLDIKVVFDSFSSTWGTINDPLDVVLVESKLSQYLTMTDYISDRLSKLIFQPLGLIPLSMFPLANPENNFLGSFPIQIHTIGSSALLFSYGGEPALEKKTLSKIQVLFNTLNEKLKEKTFYSMTLADILLTITGSILTIISLGGIVYKVIKKRKNREERPYEVRMVNIRTRAKKQMNCHSCAQRNKGMKIRKLPTTLAANRSVKYIAPKETRNLPLFLGDSLLSINN